MSLRKITPTEEAIAVIDKAIKDLKLQKEALLATLPEQPRRSRVEVDFSQYRKKR